MSSPNQRLKTQPMRAPNLNKYSVRFYYLASGMEGRADERHLGFIEAVSETEARMKGARQMTDTPEDSNDFQFVLGCISAKLL